MPEPIAILTSGQLLEGQSVCAEAAGQRVALFRSDGRIYAIADECPHAGASLSEGWLATGEAGPEAVCPLHLWQFRLADGTGTTAPGSRVASYPVEERDGQIWITLDSPAD